MTASARPGGGELVRRLVVPLAAMTIAFGAGWSLGSGNQRASWQEAKVAVSGSTATVTTGGTAHPVEGSVPSWIDAQGGSHGAGWPACFTDLDGSSATLKAVVTSVKIDKATVDAVVAVDCRKG